MSIGQNRKGHFLFESFNAKEGGFIHVCMLPCIPTTHVASSTLEAAGEEVSKLQVGDPK